MNSTQIKTGHILWLEKETIKNIKYGKGHNENKKKQDMVLQRFSIYSLKNKNV